MFRLVAPRAVGGAQLPLPVQLAVWEELARVDTAVAWCSWNCAPAGYFAAFLPADAASAVYARPRCVLRLLVRLRRRRHAGTRRCRPRRSLARGQRRRGLVVVRALVPGRLRRRRWRERPGGCVRPRRGGDHPRHLAGRDVPGHRQPRRVDVRHLRSRRARLAGRRIVEDRRPAVPPRRGRADRAGVGRHRSRHRLGGVRGDGGADPARLGQHPRAHQRPCGRPGRRRRGHGPPARRPGRVPPRGRRPVGRCGPGGRHAPGRAPSCGRPGSSPSSRRSPRSTSSTG